MLCAATAGRRRAPGIEGRGEKNCNILNVGGGKSTTLEEVKEAQLLSSHTLPEHAGSLLLTSSA